jgi:PHD/YefM family antitoxin component YafN of YafNO toxin-antitoxin module
LKDIAYSGYRSYNRPDFLFSKEEIKSLDNLRNDTNIVIVKPDKGNGVVILDKDDYNKKMEAILEDETKFERLDEDPVKLTLQRENKVKRFLSTLKKLIRINHASNL